MQIVNVLNQIGPNISPRSKELLFQIIRINTLIRQTVSTPYRVSMENIPNSYAIANAISIYRKKTGSQGYPFSCFLESSVSAWSIAGVYVLYADPLSYALLLWRHE